MISFTYITKRLKALSSVSRYLRRRVARTKPKSKSTKQKQEKSSVSQPHIVAEEVLFYRSFKEHFFLRGKSPRARRGVCQLMISQRSIRVFGTWKASIYFKSHLRLKIDPEAFRENILFAGGHSISEFRL